MSKSYKNPIIIEQLVEVHLHSGALTPNKFFQFVPILNEKGLEKVEFVNISHVTVGETPGTIQQSQTPRVRCWDSTNQKLVQLGPDLVVVNLVGKYPGWDSFRNLFEDATKALEQLNIKTVASLALKTIDRFEVKKKDFSLEQYLNCGGPMIPSGFKGSKNATDIILGQGNLPIDHFNKQFKARIAHKQDSMEILVESTFQRLLAPADDIDIVLEELHEQSNSCFESWITMKTREEIMGGIK